MIEEVRREIEKADSRFGEGIRRGDAPAVGALYAEDALLMPPNMETIRGREGTTEFWAGAIKMGVQDAVLTTLELRHEVHTVEEVGNYRLKIHPEGQAPFEDKGKYMVLWKQDADGTWRMHRDIWNSSLPVRK